ncbi:hypothetical protein V2G26_004606 [Clonostachys chloroleuca]
MVASTESMYSVASCWEKYQDGQRSQGLTNIHITSHWGSSCNHSRFLIDLFIDQEEAEGRRATSIKNPNAAMSYQVEVLCLALGRISWRDRAAQDDFFEYGLSDLRSKFGERRRSVITALGWAMCTVRDHFRSGLGCLARPAHSQIWDSLWNSGKQERLLV